MRCGSDWSSRPGDSAAPPVALPTYMAVIVTSTVSKSGSSVGGNTASMVIVRTNGGYAPDPGHAGTGTVIGVVCP